MDPATPEAEAAATVPLHVLLKEDLHRIGGHWSRPGLHALAVYRLGRWARVGSGPAPLRFAAKVLHRILNTLVIHNVYGTEISARAVIGRRVLIGHHQAVQIPDYCVIGDGTVVRHNVNIAHPGPAASVHEVPHIGRNVKLGSGCCIVGPITIGDGARIGPNCVVISDVPAGATLMAPPPRMFKASTHSPVGPTAQTSADTGRQAASLEDSPTSVERATAGEQHVGNGT
jgi:serine O-acetyltransferase